MGFYFDNKHYHNVSSDMLYVISTGWNLKCTDSDNFAFTRDVSVRFLTLQPVLAFAILSWPKPTNYDLVRLHTSQNPNKL